LFSHFSPEAIIELLVVLGIMVLVHEFGHFAVAKLCGIRVETFSIGFGKRLFGFRRGDTDYRLSLLPLGGYVKMAGDTPGEAPSGDPGEFNAHPRWQRILVALAGPVANFILAIAMMTALYMFHYEKPAYLDGAPMADYVPANTPAAAVGLEPGDTIVHFADQENPSWDDIGNKSLLNLDRVVPFSYMHDGKRVDTNLKIESKSTPERFTLDAVGLVPLFQKTPIQIADVGSGTPAERAGLKPKDIIQSMDGITIHSIIALQAYLQDQAGKPMELTLLRDGQKVNTTLTPEISETTGVKAYRMGIQLMAPPAEVEKHSFPQALGESVTFFTKSSLLIRDVFKGMFTRHVSVKQLSGPIGIGQMVHIAFQMKGWNPLVELMSGISINLGIFNLLPIPILDGGMILFLLIESLFRRDINQVAKERIYQAAFVCLLCFAAFVIFNDLTKLVAR
jgi:regulator of sigma E protease